MRNSVIDIIAILLVRVLRSEKDDESLATRGEVCTKCESVIITKYMQLLDILEVRLHDVNAFVRSHTLQA